MEQIAKELSKLNATMAEILYLIQKEIKDYIGYKQKE